jgi:hypothetical protein
MTNKLSNKPSPGQFLGERLGQIDSIHEKTNTDQ